MKLNIAFISIASAYSIANFKKPSIANVDTPTIPDTPVIPKGNHNDVVDSAATRKNAGMTFYDFGSSEGSCGGNHSNGDMVVALANPQCGRQIQIHAANGKSCTATVVDTCPGCGGDQIDATPGVWQSLGLDQNKGYVTIDWSYI
jgi:predicted RNA-binding Zn-ribbon protein involved in translation (DUF1610 family)